MTLRDDLIEALEYNCHVTEDLATDALDAILTTLADRPDEWCESSDDTKMLDRAIPVELIEALRA